MNQTVKTSVGVAIIIIVALTAMFITWKWIEGIDGLFSQQPVKVVSNNPGAVLEKQTSINQSGQVLDETSNWKTYHNDEYGFELKYPSDGNIIKSKDNNISFKKSDSEGEMIDTFNLVIIKKPDAVSVEKDAETYLAEYSICVNNGTCDGVRNLNNFIGVKGLYIMELPGLCAYESAKLFIPENKLILEFHQQCSSWDTEKILSTLKFTK